jgi:hypothetical protein
VYGDDVMTVRTVRKWNRVFENGQMNIHDDDSTGVPNPSRADVNPEPVKELAFATLIKHSRGC